MKTSSGSILWSKRTQPMQDSSYHQGRCPILNSHCRAATGIGNTDFLLVTDFFAQNGGKPNIFR